MLVETSTATDCAKLSNIFTTSSVLLLDTWDVPPRVGFRDILGCPNLSHLGLVIGISWQLGAKTLRLSTALIVGTVLDHPGFMMDYGIFRLYEHIGR